MNDQPTRSLGDLYRERQAQRWADPKPTNLLKAAVGCWTKGDYARAEGLVRAAERAARLVQLPPKDAR